MIPSVTIVLAVGRRGRLTAETDGRDDAPDAIAVSRMLDVAVADLTTEAAALMRHLPCLSPVEADSLLVVESHVDAAAIYRHNARLALIRTGAASSFMRVGVTTMEEWEDFAHYRDEEIGPRKRAELDRPMRLAWQWTLHDPRESAAAHVNREAASLLAFGRPVTTANGPLRIEFDAATIEARAGRLRAFAEADRAAA